MMLGEGVNNQYYKAIGGVIITLLCIFTVFEVVKLVIDTSPSSISLPLCSEDMRLRYQNESFKGDNPMNTFYNTRDSFAYYLYNSHDGDNDHSNSNPDEVTVVTALYLLPKSKHSELDYMLWTERFFQHIDAPIVMYTNEATKQLITGDISVKNRKIKFITTYVTPFSNPTMEKLQEAYNQQWEIDPENNIHAPELYAIWNSKTYFVNEVARVNPFKTKFFFWVDSGVFRGSEYNAITTWPDSQRVHEVFKGKKEHQMIFGQIQRLDGSDLEEDPSLPNCFPKPYLIEGTFFGGSAYAIQQFHKAFWDYHDYYLMNGQFVGKDQIMMSMIVTFAFRDAILIPTFEQNYDACGDEWFYFLHFFAKEEERPEGCRRVALTSVNNEIRRMKVKGKKWPFRTGQIVVSGVVVTFIVSVCVYLYRRERRLYRIQKDDARLKGF